MYSSSPLCGVSASSFARVLCVFELKSVRLGLGVLLTACVVLGGGSSVLGMMGRICRF